MMTDKIKELISKKQSEPSKKKIENSKSRIDCKAVTQR